jgi:hypothetical protein
MYYFVEEKIKKSIEDGDFDDLPGMGKPLDLKDDLPGLPPELKMAYKTLKNAGYLSENNDKKQNSITVQELINSATDGMHKEMVKGEFQKRLEFGEYVKKRKLHANPKFSTYAKKIYSKLFHK